MKRQFVLLFSALVLLASCGGKSDKKDEVKEESTTTDNSSTSSSDDNSSSSSADESTRRIEELKKVKPLTNEQLKSFFPEEVMGLKRKSFSVSNSLGYAVGSAEYGNDNNDFNVVIYDCAGEAGSGFYGMQYLTTLNMETETESGYSKTVNYKGSKAWETYTKSNNEHQLHFFYGDRFWLTSSGRQGLDSLKSFIDALDLDKLKSMK